MSQWLCTCSERITVESQAAPLSVPVDLICPFSAAHHPLWQQQGKGPERSPRNPAKLMKASGEGLQPRDLVGSQMTHDSLGRVREQTREKKREASSVHPPHVSLSPRGHKNITVVMSCLLNRGLRVSHWQQHGGLLLSVQHLLFLPVRHGTCNIPRYT